MVPNIVRWYSHSMYAAPSTIPLAATAAQTQLTTKTPCRISTSPMNPLSVGSPIDDIIMIRKIAA